MQRSITVLFSIVGVIHLLPLSGVVGNEQLNTLYGLPLEEANISILMRHRAVMFGLFGVFFIYAGFKRQYQMLGFIAGFVSVLSFVALSWSTGDYNEAIHRVVVADVVASICLSLAAVLAVVSREKS